MLNMTKIVRNSHRDITWPLNTPIRHISNSPSRGPSPWLSSISSPSPPIHHSKRTLFSQRKTQQLESLANEQENATNPTVQAELYKELLKSGNYQAIVHRFENQPQLRPVSSRYPDASRTADIQIIQQDKDCLKAYITALAKDGKIDRLVAQFSSLINPSAKKPITPNPTRINPESKEYMVNMDQTQLSLELQTLIKDAIKSVNSSTQRSNRSEENVQSGPLHVVVSETWSWSKIIQQFGSRLIYGLVLLTGVSIFLEQQGLLKTGFTSGEPEPLKNLQTIKFEDVQGVDEAKQDLEEIVDFLKDPKKFMHVGGKLPKGVLLYGPPGTGKTHLARAIAGEAGVPFFQMSGSEFDEMYVGIGAKRVRDLFSAARKSAPCIVFIDELDALGSKRNARDQSYMRQTLNQLLVELDGFSPTESVIFIGATNTPDALDKALVRPGRIDKHVAVSLPDVAGRKSILQVHSKNVKLNPKVNLEIIARGTPGFSGADLANLINQAALKASKEAALGVRLEDLEWAKDKIIMGAERKSAVITEESKRLTAYHEGGHAIVAMFTPGADPLHKITVIPRGNALGLTVQLPEVDRTGYTKKELNALLDVCMGGRVAEELFSGPEDVTTGALSDLSRATSIAKSMVFKYGMNTKMGLMSLEDHDIEKLSSETKAAGDLEIKMILDTSYARAMQLLKSKRVELDRLAKALMDYETLTGDETKMVIKGEKLIRTI